LQLKHLYQTTDCIFFRTLVGAGLSVKSDFRQALPPLIPSHIVHIPENVRNFSPATSAITTESGRSITYDYLVVSTGLQINWDAITGLSKALVDPSSGVSSIYSYETCDKVWNDIETLRSGNAVFSQPAGIIKCAGGE
jgi:NADPH-dependent 2,4-dienoyl-CoA reductase/sulfur reductase-like enzyme